MKKETYDVIVIGGGPAGMMAAGCAANFGASVLLMEKNERLGKKLSITGGGRCNVTNAQFDTRLFLESFPEAKQFLYSPFSRFGVRETFTFFEDQGLPLIVEEGGRAFPHTQKAEDVCRVFERFVKQSGRVNVQLHTALLSFVQENGILCGVVTSRGMYRAQKIILATGGYAAPETGSTGECLIILARLGHTIQSPSPHLCPLRSPDTWVHALAGISLEDVQLSFFQKNKKVFKKTGRFLFTHFGVSGPLVINASFKAQELLAGGSFFASLDLFPGHDIKQLDTHLVELFDAHKNKQCQNVLRELLQKKLAESILKRLPIALAEKEVHSITKEERRLLIERLKDLRFTINGTMGLDWSIVADGGVDAKEIDFKTMTSRLFPNLYLIGDTLDINRPSGGYSLQLCWTTGFVAGEHAAREVLKNKEDS